MAEKINTNKELKKELKMEEGAAPQEAPAKEGEQKIIIITEKDLSKYEGNVKEDIVVEPLPEEAVATAPVEEKKVDVHEWKPKTDLGRKVKNGEIKSVESILDNGRRIMEPEIVDILLPNIESDLLLIGQSKGKFGGGQRRVFKQTQKKTQEGNKPKFATISVVGNKDGIVGIGYGKAKETVPAREKSFRNAKLNLIKIMRGCGDWRCGCKNPHSIPFKVRGKCGSVIVTLMPAPKGKGLCVEKECQKILAMAGIKDVWSKARGQTGSKLNLILACFEALKQLMSVKLMPEHYEALGIIEGEKIKLPGEEKQQEKMNE